MPTDLGAELLSQWQNSPRLRAIVTDVIEARRDNVLDTVEKFKEMLDIDTAEGVWLDWLALRIGIRRPSVSDPTTDTRFGFDLAGVGFDQAPFRGIAANDAVYPLPDEPFRRIVKAATHAVYSDGTIGTLRRSIREIDPTASVTDLRNMTVRVVTETRDLIETADTVGALARNGGVGLVYADRQRFGFDDAGVPFDQGPFTGG